MSRKNQLGTGALLTALALTLALAAGGCSTPFEPPPSYEAEFAIPDVDDDQRSEVQKLRDAMKNRKPGQ